MAGRWLSLLEYVQIYKERKNLAYTLQDARGVVSKLELIMGVMMHVLFVFFYLIIFDVSLAILQVICNAGTMLKPLWHDYSVYTTDCMPFELRLGCLQSMNL